LGSIGIYAVGGLSGLPVRNRIERLLAKADALEHVGNGESARFRVNV